MSMLTEVEAAVHSITTTEGASDECRLVRNNSVKAEDNNGWVFNLRRRRFYCHRYRYSLTERKILRKHKYRECWRRVLGIGNIQNQANDEQDFPVDLEYTNDSSESSDHTVSNGDNITAANNTNPVMSPRHTYTASEVPLSFQSQPSYKNWSNQFYPRPARRNYGHDRLIGGLACSPPKSRSKNNVNFIQNYGVVTSTLYSPFVNSVFCDRPQPQDQSYYTR